MTRSALHTGKFWVAALSLSAPACGSHYTTSMHVDPFEIDQREVTVREYAICVVAGKCSSPSAADNQCNWDRVERLDHPINCVTVSEAKQYCDFVRKRLPTQEEWAMAAGGGEGRRFPWGEASAASQPCWSGPNRRYQVGEGTCPVGTHPNDVSPLGVLDMAGNVEEWTSSETRWGYEKMAISKGGSWKTREEAKLEVEAHGGTTGGRELQPTDTVGFRCAR